MPEAPEVVTTTALRLQENSQANPELTPGQQAAPKTVQEEATVAPEETELTELTELIELIEETDQRELTEAIEAIEVTEAIEETAEAVAEA